MIFITIFSELNSVIKINSLLFLQSISDLISVACTLKEKNTVLYFSTVFNSEIGDLNFLNIRMAFFQTSNPFHFLHYIQNNHHSADLLIL